MAPSVVVQEAYPPQFAAEKLLETSQNELCNQVNATQYAAKFAAAKSAGALSRKLIGQALLNHVSSVDADSCEPCDEDSFFVCDLGEVMRAFKTWREHLPQVQPFYAVKCNTDRTVIAKLASMGCNFDCASKQEFDTILSMGIDASRIIYANPCKTNSFIRSARDSNIGLTTVDNAHELYKLQKFHPGCGILLRIATDDESAQCRLSTKFGCSVSTAIHELLPLALELGLQVKGVAFHVGSGATDFTSIYKAIEDARRIFDTALSMPGMEPLQILDIGGGFQQESFADAAMTVNMSLSELFPADFVAQYGVKFMGEPGRFMVANAFTLAANVIARRDVPRDYSRAGRLAGEMMDQVPPMIYINDGVYGNMNCILFDHQHPQAFVLTHKGEFMYNENETIRAGETGGNVYSIWGPTCDGLDCVSSKAALSHDVQVGDWLYFPELGAYTSAASTSFNGFKGVADVIYVCSEQE